MTHSTAVLSLPQPPAPPETLPPLRPRSAFAYGVLVRERGTDLRSPVLPADCPSWLGSPLCDVLTYRGVEVLVDQDQQHGSVHAVAAQAAMRWAHAGHRVIWHQLSEHDVALYIDQQLELDRRVA